jgi:hypothetical protein
MIVALLLALGALQADEKQTSKDPEIREINLEYKDASLTEVFVDLQKKSGIPIEMDERARKAVDPDQTLLTTTIRNLPLYKSLYLAVRHLPKLSVQVLDHRNILITTRD